MSPVGIKYVDAATTFMVVGVNYTTPFQSNGGAWLLSINWQKGDATSLTSTIEIYLPENDSWATVADTNSVNLVPFTVGAANLVLTRLFHAGQVTTNYVPFAPALYRIKITTAGGTQAAATLGVWQADAAW